jgi:hypothetical protein
MSLNNWVDYSMAFFFLIATLLVEITCFFICEFVSSGLSRDDLYNRTKIGLHLLSYQQALHKYLAV